MKESSCGLDEYRQRYIHVKNELSQGLHFLVHRVLKFKSAELDFVYSFVPSFILYTCTILCIHIKKKRTKYMSIIRRVEKYSMFDFNMNEQNKEVKKERRRNFYFSFSFTFVYFSFDKKIYIYINMQKMRLQKFGRIFNQSFESSDCL